MDLSPEQFEDICTRVEEYSKRKLKKEVDTTVEGIISVFRKVFVKSQKTAPRSQPPQGIVNGETSNDVPLATDNCELSAHINSESSVSQCPKQKQTIEAKLVTSVSGASASGSQLDSDECRHDAESRENVGQESDTNSTVPQLEPYPDDDSSDDEAHITIDSVSTLDIEKILNVTFAQSSTPFKLDIQTPRLATKRKADLILFDDAGQSKKQASTLLDEVDQLNEDNVTGQENGTDSFENVSLGNRENIDNDNDTYEQDQNESQEQSSNEENANLNNTSRRSLKRSLKEEIQTPKLPPKKQKADSNVAEQIDSELNNSCNKQRKSLKRAKPNSPPPVNNEMPKRKMPKSNGPDSSANAESKQSGKWQENQHYLNIISMKCFDHDCPAQFSSKFNHDKHMKEKHGFSPVLCPLIGCSASVLNKVQWKNHVKTFHRNVTRWVCGRCSQELSTSHELYFHNVHHHQEGIFQCAQLGCRFLATTRGPVSEHYQRAHIRMSPPHSLFNDDGSNLGKDGHPIYKYRTISTLCPEENCREVLITKDDYDRHLKEAHEVLLFRCLHNNCNRSFNRRRDLDEHIRVAHSNVRLWKCFKCMQAFKDHSCLHSHVYYTHYFGHFKCLLPNCDFFSEHRADVAIHYRKMHRNNGPPRALTPIPMPHQQPYFDDMPSLDYNLSGYSYAQDEPYVPRCGMGPEQQFGDSDLRRNVLLPAPLSLPPPMFNEPTFENQPYFIDPHGEQYSDFY